MQENVNTMQTDTIRIEVSMGADKVELQRMELTSTTAPGKIFTSRADLAAHYKTPWHKYNLKRREASLPPLLESDFSARLSAAQAVHTERTARRQNGTDQIGTSHLKNGKHQRGNRASTTTAASDSGSIDPSHPKGDGNDAMQLDGESRVAVTASRVSQKQVEINPKQCLFDRHVSATVQANVDRMHRKYGFFIPDYEYLTDMTGLIGYCHEKVQLGNVCLYCHRTFRTSRSCIQHMRNKNHTKLRYEMGIDLEDLDVFYDFTEANDAFLNSTIHPKLQGPTTISDDEKPNEMDEENDEDEEDIDEEWEDVSDDDNEGNDDEDNEDDLDDDDEDLYHGYEEEVTRMGWKISPLGELIFPDGRIIGHRGLRRYYKQRLPQHKETSVAVSAARQVAGERLYRGRVYNIGYNGNAAARDNDSTEMSRALAVVGIAPGIAAGRSGKGILVTTSSGTYSQVSVYRYKAALRKQRLQLRQGQQLIQRTTTNMNRMDKKANRLINNVSVAHAKR